MKKLKFMLLLLAVSTQGYANGTEEEQIALCAADQCSAYNYCLKKNSDSQCDMSELCESKPVNQDNDRGRCVNEDDTLLTILVTAK